MCHIYIYILYYFIFYSACITKIIFSDDENYILSSSLDNKVCLWNVNTHLHINTYKGIFYKNFMTLKQQI